MKTQFDIWLEKVNKERKDYFEARFSYKPYSPLEVKRGNKFIKLISENTVWGFVSMIDGEHKGVPIRKGDLMKAASRNQPAKHSRGNIFDRTDSWEYYGPEYLK